MAERQRQPMRESAIIARQRIKEYTERVRVIDDQSHVIVTALHGALICVPQPYLCRQRKRLAL